MTQPDPPRSDGRPTDERRWPSGALALWHLAAWMLVLTLPAWIRLGEPFWRLEPALTPQVPVLGMAYLGLLLLAIRGGLARIVLAGAVCFAAAWGLLLLRPDLPYSRLVLLASGALAVGFTAVPALWKARPWALAGGLGAITAIVLGFGLQGGLGEVSSAGAGGPGDAETTPGLAEEPRTEEILRANRHLLRRIEHNVALPTNVRAQGGGLEVVGETILLATGSGEFYYVEEGDGDLTYRALPIPPPMERQAFLEYKGMEDNYQFRVLDMMVDSTRSPRRLIVSHHRWHPERSCLTVAVSATTAPPADPQAPMTFAGWETLYDSRPCFEIPHEVSNRSGGRLARDPQGRLLLTLGTYRHDGVGEPGFPQDPEADYGRILALDEDGGRTVYTEGHRNPQGLLVTSSGTIWETEHGPQGGDELNRITADAHYGWPWRTHGTEYGLSMWPLQGAEPEPTDFTGPTYTWVPSIGISQVIEVRGDEFPRWQGDLLIASLTAESLHRVHLEGYRAAYVEPIHVGARIRDLILSADGRLFLWTDDARIIVLEEARLESAGERLFVELCSSCHEAGQPGIDSGPAGPDLEGIYERFVATGDFDYSEGLRSRAGIRWNEGWLSEFLRSPETFAPGTPMVLERALEEEEIRALVEYVKTYER